MSKDEARETGVVRRVTFGDFEAVMNINNDVYEGLDYMPALFYIFLHSKQHEMYLYEENGKVISLVNMVFPVGERDKVYLVSGRVHPSHQGQGLSKVVMLPLHRDHPEVTGILATTMNKPNIQRKVDAKEINAKYFMNILAYKLPDRFRIERFLQQQSRPDFASMTRKLSHPELTRWMDNSDELILFLSKFNTGCIPSGMIWTPTGINHTGLRSISLGGNILLTQSSIARRPDDKTSTVVLGFSYSVAIPCKYGIVLNMVFFGDDCNIFISHFVEHLRHCVSLTNGDDVKIAYFTQFPVSIRVQEVEDRLGTELGTRLNNRFFSATQMIHYYGNVPKAKL